MKMLLYFLKVAATGICGAALLTGCASTPRGLQHEASRPEIVADVPQSRTDLAFAETAGKLAVGTTTVVPSTPIGTASVTVGEEYMNALGETCRRVELKNPKETVKGSACLGADKIWRFVRPL